MNSIAIHWSINSSVAFISEGTIKNAVSEERFSRKKNDSSFPLKALNWILKENKLDKSDIDYWILPGFDSSRTYQILRRYDSFKIEHYVKEQNDYWHPKLYNNQNPNYIKLFNELIDKEQFPSEYWKKQITEDGDITESDHDFRKEVLAEYLNIDTDKIVFIEHHNCHASYAYYASPFLYNEKVLAVTLDGIGDGFNATVGIFDENANYKRLYNTDKANIGRMYRYVTLLLGMKPNEHEFKMMGLASYAKEAYLKPAEDIFWNHLDVDDGQFVVKNDIPDNYFYFREKFQGIRFDNIAGGIQRYVEGIIIKWVEQLIDKHKVDTVVFGGGVAMNIKAMGELAKSSKVKKLFVPGNPADETNCIGSLYYHSNQQGYKCKRMDTMYLGEKVQPSKELIEKAKQKYNVTENPQQSYIANLLKEYKIIGRCAGPMEFGARALGNRSILARPDDASVIKRINAMIKNRDFWMPFAPIILEEFAQNYLHNEKNVDSSYMTIGFETTQLARKHLCAGLHPADSTARAQVLKHKQNPELYETLKQFEDITGIGGVLNTSFNLHGYPIVRTCDDAYYVFENSDLNVLWLDNLLIEKR